MPKGFLFALRAQKHFTQWIKNRPDLSGVEFDGIFGAARNNSLDTDNV